MDKPSDVPFSIRVLSPAETRLRAKMVPHDSGAPSWVWDHWKERNQVMEAELKRRSSFEELHKLQPPIVGGQAHLEMLRELASRGDWDGIDTILNRQARNAIKYWKLIIGWKKREGGRPPGSGLKATITEHIQMVAALLPGFTQAMEVRKAVIKKYRHRAARESELSKNGFNQIEILCLLDHHTARSAAIAYVSQQVNCEPETLERAYRRRTPPAKGYGSAYGASNGND